MERSSSLALNREQRLAQWSMANSRLRASRATTSLPRSPCCNLVNSMIRPLLRSASKQRLTNLEHGVGPDNMGLPEVEFDLVGTLPRPGNVQTHGERSQSCCHLSSTSERSCCELRVPTLMATLPPKSIGR